MALVLNANSARQYEKRRDDPNKCPCCGSTLDAQREGVFIDREHSAIVIDSQTIHLEPMELRLFEVLHGAWPRTVTREEAMMKLYPDPDYSPDDDRGAVTVRICTLRKKLKGTRVSVSTFYGKGAVLSFDGKEGRLTK